MSESTEPEVVVVTGASAGIGRATAEAFGERGARVGLLARGEEGLEGAKRDVEAAGGEAVSIPTDVAEMDQVEEAATVVEDEFGAIDVWVNCAMTTVFSPVAEMNADEYRRVTEVTYLGYVHGTMTALERMRPRDGGTIVQVGSALSYRGIPLQSAYCASKHAIKGFTESLRTELIHDDSEIDVRTVHLPGMNTPQFDWVENRLPKKPQPVPPFYQPEIAARAIVWAAHHDRRELYVGKPTLKTILGEKIAPGYLDRVLADEGYSGQLQDDPADPDAPSNLWEPVAGDHGAHGSLDDRAKQRSLQLWLTTHRKAVALLGVVSSIIGAALLWAGSNSGK